MGRAPENDNPNQLLVGGMISNIIGESSRLIHSQNYHNYLIKWWYPLENKPLSTSHNSFQVVEFIYESWNPYQEGVLDPFISVRYLYV